MNGPQSHANQFETGGILWMPPDSIRAEIQNPENEDYDYENFEDEAFQTEQPMSEPQVHRPISNNDFIGGGLTQEFQEVEPPEDGQRTSANFFTTDASRLKSAKTFQYPGQLGKFLGSVLSKNQWWSVQGVQGAGKSYLQFQMLDLFMGYHQQDAAMICWEWGPEQFTVYRDKSISRRNMPLLKPTFESNMPQTLDNLHMVCQDFKIVGLDSWSIAGFPADEFKHFLFEHPETIIVTVFQEKENGKVYGGQKPLYAASACIRVVHGAVDELNHATFVDKNRFGPVNGPKYSPFLRRLLTEDELQSGTPQSTKRWPSVWDMPKAKRK